MNLSTELLIGIVLIGMGLLLAAAAYIVLSSRKDDEDDLEETQDTEHEIAFEEDFEESPSAELEDELGTESSEAPAADDDFVSDDPVEDAFDEGAEEETPEPAAEVDPAGEEEPEPVATATEAVEAPEKPETGPRIQVATLLRDEVSGDLVVRVGEREYLSADELRSSGDWTRVEFAASDLSKWIDQPVARPAPDREVEVTDRAKPMSMIEQINEILQEKIEASGQTQLAVRLIEGTEGSARVLIGVHSYELGEVPDKSINNLIREAVAEWEAGT